MNEIGKNLDLLLSKHDNFIGDLVQYSILILNMPSNGYKCQDSPEQKPILKILDKYEDHQTIKSIKSKNTSQVFKLSQMRSKKSRNFS